MLLLEQIAMKNDIIGTQYCLSFFIEVTQITEEIRV